VIGVEGFGAFLWPFAREARPTVPEELVQVGWRPESPNRLVGGPEEPAEPAREMPTAASNISATAMAVFRVFNLAPGAAG
jgi:hypothetical protein